MNPQPTFSTQMLHQLLTSFWNYEIVMFLEIMITYEQNSLFFIKSKIITTLRTKYAVWF